MFISMELSWMQNVSSFVLIFYMYILYSFLKFGISLLITKIIVSHFSVASLKLTCKFCSARCSQFCCVAHALLVNELAGQVWQSNREKEGYTMVG